MKPLFEIKQTVTKTMAKVGVGDFLYLKSRDGVPAWNTELVRVLLISHPAGDTLTLMSLTGVLWNGNKSYCMGLNIRNLPESVIDSLLGESAGRYEISIMSSKDVANFLLKLEDS